MFSKRFFYVGAGVLCLTVAYSLGVMGAHAQSGTPVSDIVATRKLVIVDEHGTPRAVLQLSQPGNRSPFVDWPGDKSCRAALHQRDGWGVDVQRRVRAEDHLPGGGPVAATVERGP